MAYLCTMFEDYYVTVWDSDLTNTITIYLYCEHKNGKKTSKILWIAATWIGVVDTVPRKQEWTLWNSFLSFIQIVDDEDLLQSVFLHVTCCLVTSNLQKWLPSNLSELQKCFFFFKVSLINTSKLITFTNYWLKLAFVEVISLTSQLSPDWNVLTFLMMYQ